MTKRELVKAVRNRLGSVDPRLVFHIVEPAVRRDEDWWYVPVIPELKDGRTPPREFTVTILASVETKLFSDLGENVLFIPSTP